MNLPPAALKTPDPADFMLATLYNSVRPDENCRLFFFLIVFILLRRGWWKSCLFSGLRGIVGAKPGRSGSGREGAERKPGGATGEEMCREE
jgi:hypothetical protein